MNDNTVVSKPTVNADGKLLLPAVVGRLNATPAPLFGKNVVDFGANTAFAILEADDSEPDEHDFGTCLIRPGTLRQLFEGEEWYVDLSVDNPRECTYEKVVCDADGDPIIGADGRPVMKRARYTERFITVPVSAVAWLTDHPEAKHKGKTVPYMQNQRRKTTAKDVVAYALSKAGSRGKAKAKRLAPADMAALLAQISG